MAVATPNGSSQTLEQFVEQRAVSEHDPVNALKLSIAETERLKAEFASQRSIEFDEKGSIVKANMAGLYWLANRYAGSQLVPEHLQGKPDDCFIMCQLAFRCRVDPLALMQNSYIVHGKPGLEAKFATAMLNTSGHIKGRVRYEFSGDKHTRKCVAWAIDSETGERVEAAVDWQMVKAEGWDSKKGSKWMTMPDVMFRYRSATFLIRGYYPEVMMGMKTKDELEDIAPVGSLRQPARSLDDIAAEIEAVEQDGVDGPHAEDVSQVEPDEPDDRPHVSPPRETVKKGKASAAREKGYKPEPGSDEEQFERENPPDGKLFPNQADATESGQ